MNKEQATELLESRGQGHVMRGFDNLSEAQKETFLAQIENINWSDFELIGNDSADARGEFTVPPAIELDEIAARKAEFEAAGIEAIKRVKLVRYFLPAVWEHVLALIYQRVATMLVRHMIYISLSALSTIF